MYQQSSFKETIYMLPPRKKDSDGRFFNANSLPKRRLEPMRPADQVSHEELGDPLGSSDENSEKGRGLPFDRAAENMVKPWSPEDTRSYTRSPELLSSLSSGQGFRAARIQGGGYYQGGERVDVLKQNSCVGVGRVPRPETPVRDTSYLASAGSDGGWPQRLEVLSPPSTRCGLERPPSRGSLVRMEGEPGTDVKVVRHDENGRPVPVGVRPWTIGPNARLPTTSRQRIYAFGAPRRSGEQDSPQKDSILGQVTQGLKDVLVEDAMHEPTPKYAARNRYRGACHPNSLLAHNVRAIQLVLLCATCDLRAPGSTVCKGSKKPSARSIPPPMHGSSSPRWVGRADDWTFHDPCASSPCKC